MKKKPLKELSNLETVVMELIWEKGKATSNEIREELEPERPLALTTVLTILSRLRKKGYIKETPHLGRRIVFKPAFPRESVGGRKMKTLLDSFFKGSAASLVAQLLKEEKIDDAELARIERMIGERKKQKNRR